MPPEARGTTPAAAEAFVRHWVEVLNYSGPAGDSRQLRRISGSDCLDCDAIADAIQDVSRRGGRIAGRGWTVLRLRPSPGSRSSHWVVRADVQVHPQTVVPTRDGTPQRFAGGKRLKVMYLAPNHGSWVMERLDQSSG
jgi:hypothetical protein